MSTDTPPVGGWPTKKAERTPLMRVRDSHQGYVYLYLFADWKNPHSWVDHRMVLDAIKEDVKPVRDEIIQHLRILIKEIEAIDNESDN